MDLRKSAAGSGRFSSALASAVFEWILILLLFIEASICYLVTKFSRFCELVPPCILCSRIDHLLNGEEPRFYLNLICSRHKLEISSLAFCHVHQKLADVNTMCEACLLSFATSNKSNAETYRSLVGKLGLDFDHIIEDNQLSADDDDLYVIRGDDVVKGLFKEEYMPSCSITRNCSCCSNPFKLKPHGLKNLLRDENVGITLHEKEIPAESLHGLSNIHDKKRLDKRKEWSINSSATQLERGQGVDPFSEVQYSKVEITSDSESEVPASDDDNGALPLKADNGKEAFASVLPDSEPLGRENTSAALTNINNGNIMPVGAVNLNKVLASALAESETLILMQDYISAPLLNVDNGTHVAVNNIKLFASVDLESEPLIHVEDNWPARFQSDIAQETSIDPPTYLLDTSELLSDDQLHDRENPEPLDSSSSRKDLEETWGNIIHGEANSLILSQDEEVSSIKDNLRSIGVANVKVANVKATPLDLKNWSSNEVNLEIAHDTILSGPSLSTHMDLYGEEDYTVLDNISKLLSNKKTELGFESREGSISSDIEGQTTVERLRFQIELKEKSISLLREELEKERNAAADAANQAMAMITKLQEDKAALQMAVLQYQREINRESSISPTFADILMKKGSFKLREEDERILVRQISAVPEVESPTPRVYGEQEDTMSYNISNFRPMDKNESGFESREGSILSQTEGEATVEKQKRQNELDRKSISILQEELEEERNAAADAAKAAMAMITKLQEEKAALQMAELQYQREITRENSISPSFTDTLMKKNSFKLQEEDERVLVRQIFAVQEVESATPRVYGEEEEDTVSYNISNLCPMDKNESGYESRDGSIVSETEGDATVEKLKRQIQLDRKSISLLQEELEEERNAAADAADQAMAMITKLQEEKAALQMAALQYQREMEEQAEYHIEELGMCQEELAEKEQQIQELEAELESLQYHFIAESPSNRVLEQLNSHNYKMFHETNTISKESGSLKNPLLFLEDEKSYISDHLTKLEKKLHRFSKNGVYPDDSSSDVDEDRLPNGNLARTRGEDGTQLCGSSESDIRTNGHHTGEIGVSGGSAHSQHNDTSRENSKPGGLFDGVETDGICVNSNGEDCIQFYNVSESDARIKKKYSDETAITESSHYTHQEELLNSTSSSVSLKGTQLVHENNHHKFKNKREYAGKRNDCGSLDDEVSHLRQKLEALELDRNILEHAISALRNGEDGMQLIQEIASSLQELRKIGVLQQKAFIA